MKRSGLAVAAVLFGTPAVAQPPPAGWVGPLTTPSILCDTSTQLQSIVTAFETGADAGKARFSELFNTENNRHEPACAVVAVRAATAAGSVRLGHITLGGNDFFGWMVHIENRIGDGYYLYLESPKQALKNTI